MQYESGNGYWRWPVKPNGVEILELVKNPDHTMRRKAAMTSEMMWIYTLKKEGHKLFNVICNNFPRQKANNKRKKEER
jgi:hypothetical protein